MVSNTFRLRLAAAKALSMNSGHDKYEFRSANEFIPHAKWLMTDPTLNPSSCCCEGCTKKGTKRKKSRDGKSPLSSLSLSRTSVPNSVGRVRSREANGRFLPSPVSPLGSVPPSQASTTASNSPSSSESPYPISIPTRKVSSIPPQPPTCVSTFREDDLVWVDLDVPIFCPAREPGTEPIKIKFWPGISLPDIPSDSEPANSFNVQLLRAGTRTIPTDRLLPYDAWSGYEYLNGSASSEILEAHLLFEQPRPQWDTVAGPFLYATRLAEQLTKYWIPMAPYG